MNKLSLYIHIPFCAKKCYYCDFLSGPDSSENIQQYTKRLCREIETRAKKVGNRKTDTVFFGGGTPSLLNEEQITRVMKTLRKEFQILPEAEISLEMNPGTVSREKVMTYRELGINRLSIGLQSANNDELKKLGRIHTYETFLQTWEMVRSLGFSNINIDLMSALPGQTIDTYCDTLEKVVALHPEHISAYSLIIEEGTRFEDWYGEKGDRIWELPEESEERKMYYLTKEILLANGYHRYEISNYSLPGFSCRHNEGYWTGKEYLGFGVGASSYYKGERLRNEESLESYIMKASFGEDLSMEREKLSAEDQMAEFMFLGLRRMEGVSPEEFEKRFGKSMEEVFGKTLERLIEKGLLLYQEDIGRFALTEFGIDVSNQVFMEFI